MHHTFDGPARARAVAVWASPNGLAMAIGPTLGGALISAFGWRAIFWLVLPFAAVCALLTAASVLAAAAEGLGAVVAVTFMTNARGTRRPA